MREKILKFDQLAESIDNLIADKSLTKEEMQGLISDIYYEYCDITGGHNSSSVSNLLYALIETDNSINKSTLRSEMSSIQDKIYEQSYNLERAHGIDISLESLSLSTKTGKLRQKFDDNFEGYSSNNEAEAKSFERQSKVQMRFFDADRLTSPLAQKLQQNFYHSRVTTPNPIINTNNISGRTVIAADATSLRRQLDTLSPVHYGRSDLPSYLFYSPKGQNYNRETVLRGQTQISSQYKPSQGNLANIYDTGMGCYGRGNSKKGRGYIPNILEVINTLTQGNIVLEQKLAALLIYHLRMGLGFTEAILINSQFPLPPNPTKRTQLITQLDHITHTCCLKEVARRMNHGFETLNDGTITKKPELPFGTVGAMALKLLRDGNLQMRHVFDADAPYGIFSGQSIMSPKNLIKTLGKFEAVSELYSECYKPEAAFVFELEYDEEGIIPTREHLHKLCMEIYGGEDESSDEDYTSSDDEDEPLATRFRSFSF